MEIEEKIYILLRDAVGFDNIPFSAIQGEAKNIRLREDMSLNESNAKDLYFKIKDIYPDFQMNVSDAEKLITLDDAFKFIKNRIKE